MKKIIMIALALVAGASLHTAHAGKKKVAQKKETVTLVTPSDSLSYAAGMSFTNGLIPFLKQQQGVDTDYMADFIRGFREAIQAGGNPQYKAYAAGIQIADQLKGRMLPDIQKEFTDSPDSVVASLFYQGFADALMQDTTLFKQTDADAYFKTRRTADKKAKEDKLYGANRRAGEDFLAANAKKEGVVVLPSGLQYKELVKGTGETPKATDKVLVNYEGRLVDGKVFDASAKHGNKPASFRANQVIRGWTEALTRMPVGSKWELYIPYQLGYGEHDMGEIKPFSALIFTVEVVGIEK
ncbi:MAG: FKBP-type peptidyl-prolyl cis-trans isomerase [Prevotella sp.]|jgi:FKBP-type peptidyl-prolyl cis-trans isomerase FklB|nr:FKBP-type peptidyl-prolyl cis-trans isomerase [Prevotella sp.]